MTEVSGDVDVFLCWPKASSVRWELCLGRQSLRNTFSGQTDGLVCSGIGDESRGENGKMVEIGPVPGDGGDEFAGVGQFRDKLVLSDPLQVVADCRVGLRGHRARSTAPSEDPFRAGRWMAKVVPRPGRPVTSMFPPWRATMPCAVASPSPVLHPRAVLATGLKR